MLITVIQAPPRLVDSGEMHEDGRVQVPILHCIKQFILIAVD